MYASLKDNVYSVAQVRLSVLVGLCHSNWGISIFFLFLSWIPQFFQTSLICFHIIKHKQDIAPFIGFIKKRPSHLSAAQILYINTK